MVAHTSQVLVTVAGPTGPAFAAQLHRGALAHGFFARLGPRFLRCYYRMFLCSPHAVFLVAWRGTEPVGVLVGTTDDLAHHRWASRAWWWRLAVAGGLALLVRPRVLVGFVRTRSARYLRALCRLRQTTASPDRARSALARHGRTGTLHHLAVVDTARSDGAGRALVESFCDITRAVGAQRLTTSTRAGEAGASGFYCKLGWQPSDITIDLEGNQLERLDLLLS